MVLKSENSKIRVLIYNSSDSAITATFRDLYYSPIFPIIRFFRFFRLSSDYTYFSDSPIIKTIYTILPFFRLYDSSDCSDCPPIHLFFSDFPIFPIIRFFRLSSDYTYFSVSTTLLFILLIYAVKVNLNLPSLYLQNYNQQIH